jgi:hypothetical protein
VKPYPAAQLEAAVTQKPRLEHVRAWVVTFTYAKPVNVAVGCPEGNRCAPILVTHANVVVHARTGRFLLGFFTR